MPQPAQVLASRNTVRADDVGRAHATISELFCEHRLAPAERGLVRMSLRSAHERGVGIDLLDYGAPVRIAPVGLEDFHLVQIPLAGRAAMDVGHAHVESSPSVATVPPVEREFTLTWDRATPHLIVYVRRDRLLSVAGAVFGTIGGDGLRLAPRMALDTTQGRAFLRAVFEMHDAIEHTGADGAYARALAVEVMLARLLAAVESSASRFLSAWSSAAVHEATRGDRLYRRFLERAEADAGAQPTMVAIAEELQVPLRTLQDHVRAASGRTPTAILRDARFRQARRRLLDGDPTRCTVTSVALACGFGHLGRFSAEYRMRYGESPVETLRG
ncbi:AraC family transcriptional regulator [Xylanimonas allomyrinae]|uniref:AraC family transcriptional regulator n=2 Tax=Xylanimonas allomyrinae TaxID=2509459 RepID=A0A4P6EQW7_9MICO|nr:AraC family transcriptional regulator [Xylanimonas allomyrinae]